MIIINNNNEAKNFLTQIRNAVRKIIKEETSNNMKISTAEVVSINGNLAKVRLPYSPEDGSGDFEVPMVTRQEILIGDIVNIGYWCNLSTGILLSKTGQSGTIGPGPGGSGVTSFNGRTGVVVPENGDYTASEINFILSDEILSTDVQNAIEEVNSNIEKHNTSNNPHENMGWITSDNSVPTTPSTIPYYNFSFESNIQNLGTAVYWKNEFGEVTLILDYGKKIDGDFEFNWNNILGTLPVGFRPKFAIYGMCTDSTSNDNCVATYRLTEDGLLRFRRPQNSTYPAYYGGIFITFLAS